MIKGESGSRRARARVASSLTDLRESLAYLHKTDQPDGLRMAALRMEADVDELSLTLGGYRHAFDGPDRPREDR